MHPRKLKNCLQSYCFPGEESGSQNKQGTQHAVGSAKPYINNKWRAEAERSFNLSWNSIYSTPAHLHQNSRHIGTPNEQLTWEGSNTNTGGAWREYGNTDLTFKSWRKQSENGEASSVFSELSQEGGRWEAAVPWERPLHFWTIWENVLLTFALAEPWFPVLQQLTQKIHLTHRITQQETALETFGKHPVLLLSKHRPLVSRSCTFNRGSPNGTEVPALPSKWMADGSQGLRELAVDVQPVQMWPVHDHAPLCLKYFLTQHWKILCLSVMVKQIHPSTCYKAEQLSAFLQLWSYPSVAWKTHSDGTK